MPSRTVVAWSLAGLLFVAALAGCGGASRIDAADAGRTHRYEPGLPNFDLEAVVTWRAGAPGVDVYVGIPPFSLVFVHDGGGYQARYELLVRLLDRRGRDQVAELARTDTVRVTAYEATQTYHPLIVRERLAVAPGAYVVEVTLTDAESDKDAVRRQAVELQAAEGGRPGLSPMRLEARRAGHGFEPVVSLHLPAGMDSLRGIVELYHLGGAPDVEVGLTLLRFESDTTVAAPPYWLTPTHGSLAYRGVSRARPDTLQRTRRLLQDVDREAVVEFDLPELGPGLYRVETTARTLGPGSGEVLLQGHRDLSVKPLGFPHLDRLDALVEALAYIADPDELARMREAPTPQERKRRFDAFWGSLLPNRQAAANLVKLYYGRVEEANLFFTSYKEGWKTDRGMVYIVLGPPYHVEHRIDGEVWFYSYGDRDATSVFAFERARSWEPGDPFEGYVLERHPMYQQAWRWAVDRWRTGDVL